MMEDVYKRFHSYDFEADDKFRKGLVLVDGSSAGLDIQLFYYNRCVEPIDPAGYQQWRSCGDPREVEQDVMEHRDEMLSGPEPDEMLSASGPEPDKMLSASGPEPDKMLSASRPEPEKMLSASGPEPDKMLSASGPEPEKMLSASGPEPDKMLSASGPEPEKMLSASGPEPDKMLSASGPDPGVSGRDGAEEEPEEAQKVLSFQDLMRLVEAGESVPGLEMRVDITPSNQNPTPSRMERVVKPWETR